MSKNNTKRSSGKASMNVQKKWIIALLAVILIVICAIIIMIVQVVAKDGKQPEAPTLSTTQQMETEAKQPTDSQITLATDNSENTDPSQNTETEDASEATNLPTTTPAETEPEASETTKPTQSTGKETEPATKETEPPTNPTQSTTVPDTEVLDVPVNIELPYVIPGTMLELQRIADYDGIYLEDGTNESVSDVAMILVHNSGTQAVEYVEITIVFENGELGFTASAIPGNGYIVIQEKNRGQVPSGKILECRADVAPIAGFDMSDELIQVTDNGDDSLSVTNLTDNELVTVRLFYKYYMEDNDVYVGGITYTAKISNLAAKATIVIEPTHYSSEGSKVVMVRTYDEDV